ncbi:hypothetical protein BATDEDRAFT_91610 [Batrachochytrium dendrobatidis JAM81]|uniref:H/ACA ribonucleoprotein complex non-core subunit NAF1 n=1 Tax=Batrachochytrium dendrobatidis (strain JAM81 / FGSC 10211) TaxID=684364 RepID=F4PB27_BATDJ|nr:uncharacterized protein BATDEDRAFT_91610 [Batrachochytrium dendrobatidis JAM81]EGF77649.1 hypothetical protein BATDEDRAFT_91610 [Batrachochytrium dendrobatidis JAM81]|eukprot:XP_006681790.1 hypothetical protein BATDEDRAFT_91610 [Batrachochytrium dendrobatidis JAM81]
MSFYLDTTPTEGALQQSYMLHSEQASDYDSPPSTQPLELEEAAKHSVSVDHTAEPETCTEMIANTIDLSTANDTQAKHDSSIVVDQIMIPVEPALNIPTASTHPTVTEANNETNSVLLDGPESSIEVAGGDGSESDASKVTFSDSSSDCSSESSDDNKQVVDGNKKRRANTSRAFSDDDDDDATTGVIATKNEAVNLLPVEPITFEIPTHLPIVAIGAISAIVDTLVVIKASVGGEVQVLDADSILFFQDRSILGRIFDTFGPVNEPLYTVRFNSAADIAATQAAVGTSVYFIENLAKIVLTQPLRLLKGSDASNLYDEEVAADEIEYSDDEKEIEHRRLKKNAKKSRGDAQKSQRNADNASSEEEGAIAESDTLQSRQTNERGRYRGGDRGNGRGRMRGRGMSSGSERFGYNGAVQVRSDRQIDPNASFQSQPGYHPSGHAFRPHYQNQHNGNRLQQGPQLHMPPNQLFRPAFPPHFSQMPFRPLQSPHFPQYPQRQVYFNPQFMPMSYSPPAPFINGSYPSTEMPPSGSDSKPFLPYYGAQQLQDILYQKPNGFQTAAIQTNQQPAQNIAQDLLNKLSSLQNNCFPQDGSNK